MNHAQLIALGRALRVAGEHGQRIIAGTDGEAVLNTDEPAQRSRLPTSRQLRGRRPCEERRTRRDVRGGGRGELPPHARRVAPVRRSRHTERPRRPPHARGLVRD
ncbi:hypothetical protein E2C11_07515 [Streptomyces lavendulae]|nr:hypothetical protein E2C11_07515 [Streptomyces lavendulae]